MRQWLLLGVVLVLTCSLAGCRAARRANRPMSVPRPASPSRPPPSTGEAAAPATGGAEMTRGQLSGRLMGFADRFFNRISEATDRLEQLNPSPECRMAAHATKYYPSVTVLALAADAEPEIALLDLMTVVTLERMVWEGEWAEEVFKEHAPILTEAQKEIEADIWGLAGSVMSAEQIAEMRGLIEEWRRQNPGRRYVSSTRFDDFAQLRDQQHSALSTGFLAPVDEATRAVDETRLLGERALFVIIRSPLIMQWQAELFVYEMALKPEVKDMLADTRNLAEAAQTHAAAADRFASAVQEFPADLGRHRDALMRDLQTHEGSLGVLVGEIREGLKEADAVTARMGEVAGRAERVASEGRGLAEALERTASTVDTFVGRFQTPEGAETAPAAATPEGEPGRPFDITEYTDAAERLTLALRELNQALAGTDQFLTSSSWERWMTQVDQLAERRVGGAGQEARDLVDRLFWRGGALIVLACGGVWVVRRLGPKRA